MYEVALEQKVEKELLRRALAPIAEHFRESGARYLIIWRCEKRYVLALRNMKKPTNQVPTLSYQPDYIWVGNPKELDSEKVLKHMLKNGFTHDNLVTEYIIWQDWYNLFHEIKKAVEESTTRFVSFWMNEECRKADNVKSVPRHTNNDILFDNGARFIIRAGQLPPDWLISWLISKGWKAGEIVKADVDIP